MALIYPSEDDQGDRTAAREAGDQGHHGAVEELPDQQREHRTDHSRHGANDRGGIDLLEDLLSRAEVGRKVPKTTPPTNM